MAIMLMRFWIIDARLQGNRGTSQGNSEFFASHLEGSDRKKPSIRPRYTYATRKTNGSHLKQWGWKMMSFPFGLLPSLAGAS